VLDRKSKIYQRREDVHGGDRKAMAKLYPSVAPDRPAQRPGTKAAGGTKLPLRDITERLLLRQYAPAGALVNEVGDILYLHGRTGRFLEPAPGEAGVNILKMAREGLSRELTAALRKAVAHRDPVCVAGLRVKTNGEFTNVNLTVRPMEPAPDGFADSNLFLVVFEETPTPAMPAAGKVEVQKGRATRRGKALAGATEADARIAALKLELQAREEYLQSTREELETSNEELKSSNEEMQSVNEEMQSTNEELETSKEELQSVNEELATVNAELQTKVADLSRANNDMNNLLAGTGIGTVFVDHQLRIQRFTPAVTQIINLIQTDVGRPVGHIVSNLAGYDRLVDDVREVLETLAPRDIEVQTRAGDWYSLRIRPYRTIENVIEGAVITFVDINTSKTLEKDLRGTQAGLEEHIAKQDLKRGSSQ
jgi:two-component system CheB/CheR fusion protein